MRATFEHCGTIIDIGTDIIGGELDTTGAFSGSMDPGKVGIAIYQRALDDNKVVNYKTSFYMKPSEARAMASVILSAATEAKN